MGIEDIDIDIDIDFDSIIYQKQTFNRSIVQSFNHWIDKLFHKLGNQPQNYFRLKRLPSVLGNFRFMTWKMPRKSLETVTSSL